MANQDFGFDFKPGGALAVEEPSVLDVLAPEQEEPSVLDVLSAPPEPGVGAKLANAGMAAAQELGLGLSRLVFQTGPMLRKAVFNEADYDPEKTVGGILAGLDRENLPKLIPTDPNLEGSVFTQTGRAIGSSVSIGAGAAAGGLPGIAAAGMLQNAIPAYQEAKAAGADDELASAAFWANAGIGALEVMPMARIVSRLNKQSGGLVKHLLIDAPSEMGTEAGQLVLSNAFAQGTYDEERELLQGVAETLAPSGLSAAILSGLASGASGKRPASVRQASGIEPPASPEAQALANSAEFSQAQQAAGAEVVDLTGQAAPVRDLTGAGYGVQTDEAGEVIAVTPAPGDGGGRRPVESARQTKPTPDPTLQAAQDAPQSPQPPEAQEAAPAPKKLPFGRERLEHPLLAEPEVRSQVEQMAKEAGLEQHGGELIMEQGDGGQREVLGRTKHLAKDTLTGGPEWWKSRPDPLNVEQTQEAVRRALAGEPMNLRERRLVEHMLDKAHGHLTRGGTLEEMRAAKERDQPIGLSKAEQSRIRALVGLEELEPAKRRGFEETLEKAKAEGLDKTALTTAQEARESQRPITDVEHAGMVIRAAELVQEYDDTIADVARLIERGDLEGSKAATFRSEVVLSQLDILTEGARLARREVARALSIGRMRVDRQTFELAPVVQRATAAKGSKLAPEEHAQFEALVKQEAEAQAAVARVTAERDAAQAERDRLIAEKLVATEAKSERATQRRQATKKKLHIEREDLKKQLVSMGYRANDISGVAPEAARLISRLALNYAREGVVTLEEVVARVIQDLPDLKPADVYRSIASKNPLAQLKARSETTKRVDAIKRQATLLAKIEDAERGIFDAPKERPAPPSEIRTLQRRLTELRALAFESLEESSRLERALQKINELQDHLDNHTRAQKKKPGEPSPDLVEAKRKIGELRRLMDVQDTLANLNEQLESGEFVVREKPAQRERSVEADKAEIALKKARAEIRAAIEGMRPMTAKRAVLEGLNTLRTLKATADMSATLRQGLVLSSRRPIVATKAFGKSFVAFFSENTAEQIDHAIRSSPFQYLRDKAGLYLAPFDTAQVNKREEQFMSNLARKIPVVRTIVEASERHMVIHLNLMRSAAFDSFVERNPNATQAELAAWADWVNVASGRGDLGRFAAIANELSAAVFAPRFAVSRFQTPQRLLKHWQHPRVRKEIAKSLAATAAVGTLALTLAAAAGADVGDDPRESDFGKARIGDTRLDFWAGFLQPMRLITRVALGLTDRAGLTGDGLPKYKTEVSPLELLGRFAAYKLAPSVTVPLEFFRGKTIVGDRVEPSETAVNAVLPILFEDIRDAYREGGIKRAAVAGTLGFLGVGASTYETGKPSKAKK